MSFVMLLKAARRVEVCPASTLAAVLLSGLAGGVAEPESRMWGHCKGPDELGLLEAAATHVDAQTETRAPSALSSRTDIACSCTRYASLLADGASSCADVAARGWAASRAASMALRSGPCEKSLL